MCIAEYPVEDGTERSRLPIIDIYSLSKTLRLIVTAYSIVLWSCSIYSESCRPETLMCIDEYPVEDGTGRSRLSIIDIDSHSHIKTLRLIAAYTFTV